MQGMQKEHFLVAGGDMRLIGTANALFEKGYDTAVYLVQESPFLNPGIPILDAPCFSDFDRIILPLPCSRDDVHLSCAYDLLVFSQHACPFSLHAGSLTSKTTAEKKRGLRRIFSPAETAP